MFKNILRGKAFLCLVREIEYSGGRGKRPFLGKAWRIPSWVGTLLYRGPSRNLVVENDTRLGLESDATTLSRIFDELAPTEEVLGVDCMCNADTRPGVFKEVL